MIYRRVFSEDKRRESKAIAFFTDHKVRMESYKPGGVYGNMDYVKKIENWASDINMLPTELKALFYSELCKILDRITHTEGYCEVETPNCTP